MNGGTLDGWTADELLAELRMRERAAAPGMRGAPRARALGARASVRARDVKTIPTAQLAKLVKGRQRVVYGVDNRKDLYKVKGAAIRRSADAVVALVEAADLSEQADGSFKLATDSYQQSYRLCGSEPFVSQPLGCFCSGFLVAKDVVATAGHCVKSAADLARMRFVFGFRMKDASTPQTTFGSDDVYRGAAVIGRALSDGDGTDWALVRLDREVIGRKPVKFRATGKIKDGAALYVIGHPCGLPQKYAPGANVRDNSPKPFFVANLDTYGGNSGSPVFNAKSSVVEGILVRGETDFTTNGTCYVSLVCPTTGCRGEDVTRATVWGGKVTKTVSGSSGATKSRRAAGAKKRKSSSGVRREKRSK